MRITKKMLRESKRGLVFRVKEIMALDDNRVDQEFRRIFPGMPENPEQYAARRELIYDAIERMIPSHWCD